MENKTACAALDFVQCVGRGEVLLPQPAGCGSVPSSPRERQREGPSADPAQRCPVGLGEVQTQFPVGNGECALLPR